MTQNRKRRLDLFSQAGLSGARLDLFSQAGSSGARLDLFSQAGSSGRDSSTDSCCDYKLVVVYKARGVRVNSVFFH